MAPQRHLMGALAAEAHVMCTSMRSLSHPVLGFVALLQLGACQRAAELDLPSGTRVVLVRESQPPVAPGLDATPAPDADSAIILLVVTQLTSDSIWGLHSGDLVHFPAQVPDDTASARAFVGARDGFVWHIELHPGLFDAGVTLTLDLRSSADSGSWINRTMIPSRGRFLLQRPGT